jgi:hypothetical protein
LQRLPSSARRRSISLRHIKFDGVSNELRTRDRSPGLCRRCALQAIRR